MTEMLNKATGQVEDVPDHAVPQAYTSGNYALPQGQSIRVVDSTGKVGEISTDRAHEAFTGGARVASDAEWRKAELEHRYGGLGGSLAAAGEGAARGLTLGLSDPLAVGTARLIGGDAKAEQVRTHLAEEREAHPYIATGSEIAGAAAPIIFSGGAAGAAEGATEAGTIAKLAQGAGILPNGVSSLGAVAEHAISGVLGSTAETALGRAGQAAAKSAVRGIVEGGLFSEGQAISDSTLQNEPLTAEKLLSAGLHGALTAGLISGAASGAGSLLSDGLKRVLSGSSDALDSQAGEQAWKWLDPGKKLSEEADSRAGGTAAVGREVYDEVLKPIVEEKGLAGAAMSQEEKLSAIQAAQDRVGKKISEAIAASDDKTELTLRDLFKPIDERIAQAKGQVLGEGRAAQLDNLKQSLARILGGDAEPAVVGGVRRSPEEIRAFLRENPEVAARMGPGGQLPEDAIFKTPPKAAALEDTRVSLSDAIAQRRALQRQVFQDVKTLDPNQRVEVMREVTSAWNDIFEQKMNEASAESGGSAGTELRDLNKKFQRLSIAEKAMETNTARYATNRNLSLSDYLSGAAHAPSMLLSGHPGAALGAIGMSYGHRMLREHGNAYAAILMDRLSTWGGVSTAVKDVDDQIDASIGKFLSSRKQPAPKIRVFHGSNEKRYQEEETRAKQIAAMAPAVLSAHMQAATGGLSTHAPKLAQAVQSQAVAQAKYLASKLPPSPPQSPLTPQHDAPAATAEQKTSFLRTADALHDGVPGIMDRFARGAMTKEDVDVLQKFHPNTLAEIRTKVQQECADLKNPLPYQKRVALGQLLGMQTDPTLDPGLIQLVQQTYHAAGQQHAPQAQKTRRGSPPSELHASKDISSEFERAMGE